MEDVKVYFMNDILNSFEKIKNMDIEDYNSVDEAVWNFTHNQLCFLYNLETSEAQEFLKNNVDGSQLIDKRVLSDMINKKLNELSENEVDIENKMLTVKISLDSDYNRIIEFDLVDNESIEINNELPPLNSFIENQIKLVCTDTLQEILDEDELENFIDDRIEDYREMPYSNDWLDGFIEGYLNNKE